MGAVFKKTATRALPAGTEVFRRKGQPFARWKDAKGKTRTAPLTTGREGQDRIVIVARTYTAKFRDGNGHVQEVSTGCRDEKAARSLLTDLERRAELVRAGVVTATEDAIAGHQASLLAKHIDDYLDHLEASGCNKTHRDNVARHLRRIVAGCRFQRLADMHRHALEKWLLDQSKAGMGARTRNMHLAAAIAFANWCCQPAISRLSSNPFVGVPKADEKAGCRRKRRALTEDELHRLLDVARLRPLMDRMTVHRGKRKGEAVAKLSDATRREMERLGRERALIYKTLVLTGLRKGELASLVAGQLNLDAEPPYLVLAAADEKNRQGSTIPLRADLAADLREWLREKAAAQDAAGEAPAVRFDPNAVQGDRRANRSPGRFGGPSCLPLTGVPYLPADTPPFNVPDKLVRILDRDLVAAGIARRIEMAPGKWRIDKRDERGCTVDVHALRHTFGTLLSKGGVAPRTAQAAMRHSTLDLTMNVYTDPRLLDVQGALDALPALPLESKPFEAQAVRNVLSATGTDDKMSAPFAPAYAPTWCKPSTEQTTAVKMTGNDKGRGECSNVPISACPVNKKAPLTTRVNEAWPMETTGIEPATPGLQSRCSPN